MLQTALRALDAVRQRLTPRHVGFRMAAGIVALVALLAALVLAFVVVGMAFSRIVGVELGLLIVAGILLAVALVCWALMAALGRKSERARHRAPPPGEAESTGLASLAAALAAGFAAGRSAGRRKD